MKPLRIAFVGWGAIARACVAALDELGANVELVAIAVRRPDVVRPNLPTRPLRILTDPSELAACGLDVVVEAAGRDAVGPWGFASLNAGLDFIVSSVSAFADPVLLASMIKAAEQSGTSLRVQPGALAGIDALASARAMGIETVEHRIVKPPGAWRGTPAQEIIELDQIGDTTIIHQSNATEAADRFPKNANVAMTTALAGIGAERTQITMIADPNSTTNRHEIDAAGAFGQLSISIANNPLPDNPKTSAMAALNLARVLANQTAAFVI